MASELYTEDIKRIHNIAFFCACDSYRRRNRIPWENRQRYKLQDYRNKLDNIEWNLRKAVKAHLTELAKLCSQLSKAKGKPNATQRNKRYQIVEKMKTINKIITERIIV